MFLFMSKGYQKMAALSCIPFYKTCMILSFCRYQGSKVKRSFVPALLTPVRRNRYTACCSISVHFHHSLPRWFPAHQSETA